MRGQHNINDLNLFLCMYSIWSCEELQKRGNVNPSYS